MPGKLSNQTKAAAKENLKSKLLMHSDYCQIDWSGANKSEQGKPAQIFQLIQATLKYPYLFKSGILSYQTEQS